MAFDPDLQPIFDAFTAGLAAIETRLDAIEAKAAEPVPALDRTKIVALLGALQGMIADLQTYLTETPPPADAVP